jgi:hypothetical protein
LKNRQGVRFGPHKDRTEIPVEEAFMENTETLPAFREFLTAVTHVNYDRFAAFVEQARHSMGNTETLPAFRAFLAAVAPLNRGRFAAFVEEARRLLVVPLRKKWEALQPQLVVLQRWITDCDLLVRVVTGENSYTELIAWALSPATNLQTAEVLQRSLLAGLNIDWQPAVPVEPNTQVWTVDGTLDLLLPFTPHPVVIEVKTESDEHPAPSGKAQTFAYPDAARKKLGLGLQDPVHMVFLTPDGREAENPRAICQSFARFALLIAKGLEQVEVPDHLRSPFGMVITILARYCMPSIDDVSRWQSNMPDGQLIGRIGDISLMTNLLLGGENHGTV